MKAWLVTYAGVYLGAAAVVMAESPEAAIELLKSAHAEEHIDDIQVKALDIEKPGVIYDDDGDY